MSEAEKSYLRILIWNRGRVEAWHFHSLFRNSNKFHNINEKGDVGLIIEGVMHGIVRREMWDYMIRAKKSAACAYERCRSGMISSVLWPVLKYVRQVMPDIAQHFSSRVYPQAKASFDADLVTTWIFVRTVFGIYINILTAVYVNI